MKARGDLVQDRLDLGNEREAGMTHSEYYDGLDRFGLAISIVRHLLLDPMLEQISLHSPLPTYFEGRDRSFSGQIAYGQRM